MLLLLFHKNVELYHSSWNIQKLTYRTESLWVIDSRSTFINFKEAGFKTKTRFFKDIFPQISSEIYRSLVFRKSNSYLDFWCLRFQLLAIFVRMLCLKMSLYHEVWHRRFFFQKYSICSFANNIQYSVFKFLCSLFSLHVCT